MAPFPSAGNAMQGLGTAGSSLMSMPGGGNDMLQQLVKMLARFILSPEGEAHFGLSPEAAGAPQGATAATGPDGLPLLGGPPPPAPGPMAQPSAGAALGPGGPGAIPPSVMDRSGPPSPLGPTGPASTAPGAPSAGAPGADSYDTGFDPLEGGRSVRNALAALGMPMIGPGMSRNMQIGNIGLGQAMASPGAYEINQFPEFMKQRMGGQLPGTDNTARFGHLMGLEGKARSLLAGNPGMSLQDIIGAGGAQFSDPSELAQFAHLASMADNPEQLGSVFGSQFGGTSLSPNLTNLVGQVLGQVLQRQNDQPGSRSAPFQPFTNLRGLIGKVQ